MKKRKIREEILDFNDRGMADAGSSGSKVAGAVGSAAGGFFNKVRSSNTNKKLDSISNNMSSGDSGGGEKKPIKLSTIVTIIIIALLLPIVYVTFNAYSGTEQGETLWLKISDVIKEYNPITWYGDLVSEQKTLDVWSSETNRSSTMKGIELDGMTSFSGGSIPQGSQFEVVYDIEYHEIGSDGVDDVNFECVMQDGDDEDIVHGEIIPQKTFTLRKNDFVSCRIPSEYTQDLDGSYSVVGWFEFPFSTEDVTLKVYYTTSDVFDQLVEDDVDFFDRYDIDGGSPRAVYNGEPVRVAIGATASNQDQPVIVGSDRSSFPILGIHLENEWAGEVVDLTDMTVYLPEGIEIDEELSLNPSSPSCPFEHLGKSDGKNVYRLYRPTMDEMFKPLIDADIPVLGDSQYTENERNFNCWLSVDPEFVGSSLYKVDEYIVSLDYLYRVDDKEDQVVIRVPGEVVT